MPLVLLGRRFFMCKKEEKTMPTINITATGDNIKKMRKAAGLTVKDLQNIFGFGTPQAIYKWPEWNCTSNRR